MLQGLLSRNPIFGIVDKDALQKIQEQTVEVGIGWNEFLGVISSDIWKMIIRRVTYRKLLHSPHIFTRGSRRFIIRIVQLASVEISGWVSKCNRNKRQQGATYLAAWFWLPLRPPCITCLIIRDSILWPMTHSIMARCSRLSCVWKSASPVKNSTSMQPILQISQGKLQPIFKIISGAR